MSKQPEQILEEQLIAKLQELRIPLLSQETGENYGRTVELYCDSGEFLIKSVGKPLKRI